MERLINNQKQRIMRAGSHQMKKSPAFLRQNMTETQGSETARHEEPEVSPTQLNDIARMLNAGPSTPVGSVWVNVDLFRM